MCAVRLLLASASPRRAELLASAGFAFDVLPVDVDEKRLETETPTLYVERVARAKAAAALRRHPARVVVAADTVVVVDDLVLGKPTDEADARRMLAALSGRGHVVLSGVAVASGGLMMSRVEETTVWFRTLSEGEIRAYVASGEPMDKAGAYAIQGLASRFVPRIDGSYGCVVGLPVAALVDLLAAVGHPAGLAVDSSPPGAVS
jgi:septum formation protein